MFKKIGRSLMQHVQPRHLVAAALALGAVISFTTAGHCAITLPDAATVSGDYMTVAAWVAGILATIFGVRKALSLLGR